MWFLYGYTEHNVKTTLAVSAVQTGILEIMCSSKSAAEFAAHGIVAWEMKQEWGNLALNSGGIR